MQVSITQERKSLTDADFGIFDQQTQIGTMHFTGSISWMEGTWRISYHGMDLMLKHGKRNLGIRKKTFRPYDVYLDGKEYGTVFQTEDGSLLNRITYNQFVLADTVYSMYTIMLGSDGMKSPVYCGSTQIAQIEKDNIVYDDLHHFRIFAVDEEAVLLAVIFCSYLWVKAFYLPGTEVTPSVQKIVGKTTHRRLLGKYDPTFAGRVSEL